jgi:hypothetical protein
MLRAVHLLALAACLSTLSGCAGANGNGDGGRTELSGAGGHVSSEATSAGVATDPRVSIHERDGVVYVENPAAGLWEGADQPPLRFELEAVFGAEADPEDAVLAAIGGAEVDPEGNVYVYDAGASELVSFAADGSVRWRTGRGAAGSGDDGAEGRGELAGVRGIAFDGAETLWAMSRSGSQLDAWGLDGRHRGTRQLAEAGLGDAYMGGPLPGGRLALMENVLETAASDYVILDLGAPLRVVERFRIASEPEIVMPPGFIFQLSHHFAGDRIYIGNWERYVLRVYDGRGNLLRHVSRAVDYLRRPGFAARDPDQYAGMGLGGLGAPIVLASGHWLVVASWPTNVDDPDAYTALPADRRPPIEWASSLDLFDAEGRFLHSVVTEGRPSPQIGRPWAAGGEAQLYTVSADPFPQVRRYRVRIDPPAGR